MKSSIRKLTAFVLAAVLALTCMPARTAMAYDGSDAGGASGIAESDAGAQGVQSVAENAQSAADTQNAADAQNVEEVWEDEAGISGDTDEGLLPAGVGTGLTLNGNGGKVKVGENSYADTWYLAEPTTDLSSYAPKKEGSSFIGWYSSADCKAEDLLSTSYSPSILNGYPEPGTEIYAGWQAAVKLDGNGGKVKGPDGEYHDYCYQEEYSFNLTNYRPVWKDHWFTGWYAEPECKTRLTADYSDSLLVNPPTPGTTLYAGWLTACKVDGNGGQVWNTESKSYVDSLFIQDDNKSS
nr:InlB B-repeat-containing protein [Lachnospiraceae bacterium]